MLPSPKSALRPPPGPVPKVKTLPDDLSNVELDVEDMTRVEVPKFSDQSAHAFRFPNGWLGARLGSTVLRRFSVPFPDSDALIVAGTHDITGFRVKTKCPDK